MAILICCRSMDEVNADLAEQWCEEQGLAFNLTDPRDALFPSDADGLVIDLDHLGLRPAETRELLQRLALVLLPYPIAVSSYNLDADAVAKLRSHGVIVAAGMDEELFGELASVIESANCEFAA